MHGLHISNARNSVRAPHNFKMIFEVPVANCHTSSIGPLAAFANSSMSKQLKAVARHPPGKSRVQCRSSFKLGPGIILGHSLPQRTAESPRRMLKTVTRRIYSLVWSPGTFSMSRRFLGSGVEQGIKQSGFMF